MYQINYYDFFRNCKDPYDIRRQIVRYALKNGIKPAAKHFETTPKTVRKWVKRDQNGDKRFKDLSKKPKISPNKISQYWEYKIVFECQKYKDRKKRINAVFLKNKFQIPYSLITIRKVMKDKNFMVVSKKKKERKRDLRELKKKYKAFEKIQVDVKYLDDIPEMYPEYIQYKLPRYQFTARCIRTGALFISYGYEKSMSNACNFIDLLLNHLKSYSIDLTGFRIQTDNGSEFIGSMNKKDDSVFTKIIQDEYNKMIHRLIPPGAKTWQSDVETSHRLIEDELYARESFFGLQGFMNKAFDYVKHFNCKRNNTYKEGSPKNILSEISPDVDTNILILKPVILDNYNDKYDIGSMRYA
ncbi:MAG: hypothetical protein KAR07_07560 [Spirochaetes bacterium]|nr:hypothetical protein [Spirochaetota bacterium]